MSLLSNNFLPCLSSTTNATNFIKGGKRKVFKGKTPYKLHWKQRFPFVVCDIVTKHKTKMAKVNTYKAVSGEEISLSMNNDQESFIPHWIVRFSSDFVADVIAKTRKEFAWSKDTDRNQFVSFVYDCILKAYPNATLDDLNAYDFSGKYNREKPKPTAKAKADTTTIPANVVINKDLLKYVSDQRKAKVSYDIIRKTLEENNWTTEQINAHFTALGDNSKVPQVPQVPTIPQ